MTVRSAIELTTFEQIEAGVGTVLLRVTGSTSHQRDDGSRPSLLLIEGGQTHRVSALPAPSDPAGVLRAAYPATASLVGPATGFALEFADGTRIGLPAPLVRGGPSRTPAQTSSIDAQSEDRRLREEAEHRAESRRRAIDELERRLQAERSHRESLEADAAERETELRRLHAEFAEHAENAAAMTAALQASADIAVAEAARHRADAERLRVQLETAQAAAADAERRASDRTEELDRAEHELQQTRERAGQLEAEVAAARADAHDALETTERMRTELVHQTEEASTTSANLQALVEIANAEAAQHLTRAERLESELERLKGEPAEPGDDTAAADGPAFDAELREARAVSGSLAAELDEAQTRADTLAEVVRAETTRREDTERELQMAHQEIDALRHELERAQLEAEAQLRQPTPSAPTDDVTTDGAHTADADALVDEEELAPAADDPRPSVPGSGSVRRPTSQEARTSTLAPPGRPAQATGPSAGASNRVRGAVQTLPAEITAGLLLFVLGIILAILVLTGLLG